jgi:Family of unknown function (DUF6172)
MKAEEVSMRRISMLSAALAGFPLEHGHYSVLDFGALCCMACKKPIISPLMKKIFKLNIEGKNRDRVLEAVKHEIRKYVARERRRVLPVGVDYWDFDCKFGLTAESAEVVHFAKITEHINAVAQGAGDQFYLEILAKHGVRRSRPPTESDIATDA